MKRLVLLAVLISLVAFRAGADDVPGAPYAHGTSVTQDITRLANPNSNGIRVGPFYDADVKKRGMFAHPVVFQEWNTPVAPASNTLCDNFQWYDNDDHTTTCVNFTSTTLWNARTIAVWVNFTDDTSYSSETCNTSFTLTGTSYWGDTISETFDIHETSDTTPLRYQTQKAFKTLTAVSWTDPAAALAAEGLDEYTSYNITFDIGPGWYLGMKYCMHSDTRLKELVDADGVGGMTADSAGAIIRGDPTWAVTSRDWRGCWAPNDVPDGTSDYGLFWICTDIVQRWPTDRVEAYYGRASP